MSQREFMSEPPDSPTSVGWTRVRSARLADAASPFSLESGGVLPVVDVEYETYGRLNRSRSNAILIVHALSGDAHAAGWDRDAGRMGRPWRARRPGWWDAMIGPGKPLDTRRWFFICSNVLGGCYGTTGPASPDPATGAPYGLRFPIVSVGDWVRLQARLIDHLGIRRLHAVIGGSLGGQQALEWALALPDRVANCVVLASAPRLSAQGLAFNAVGRHAILSDPNFRNGDYYGGGPRPTEGLAAARMMAHITYLSEEGMHRKFGRRLKDPGKRTVGFGVEFEVESYLDHQGKSFVERFDANSYLYITRAMDLYDAAQQWGGGDLVAACRRVAARAMIVSFSSDWLYAPDQSRELALALCRTGRPATYVVVPSYHGHDSFLVQVNEVGRLLRGFLAPGGGA
ncbi:MAG: homoserine O-acetyltransferase [Lentisphaerae bacterium]|nr:homoserine O-acetyltransferase [Lentisphaerota bacterium]